MDLIFFYAQKVRKKYTNKNRLYIKLEIFLYRTCKSSLLYLYAQTFNSIVLFVYS